MGEMLEKSKTCQQLVNMFLKALLDTSIEVA